MLSKYLYDERAKSKLKKEISFLNDIQKTNNMKYPFERAEKLNASMRKLSLNTNQNYIDQLRILVTHIGNNINYYNLQYSLNCFNTYKKKNTIEFQLIL